MTRREIANPLSQMTQRLQSIIDMFTALGGIEPAQARTWFEPMTLKCPDCQQYSLTYDLARNGYVCAVYNGFIPAEDMP